MVNNTENWDIVDQASWESFPASDPPGWGSFRAAPSASTCGTARKARAVRPTVERGVTLAWLVSVLLAVTSLIVAQRRLRRRR